MSHWWKCNFRQVLVAIGALGVVFSASVGAAEEPVAKIVEIQGAGAFVNDGQKLVSATLNMPLWPGYLIEAPEGGQATVRYDNGCQIEVKERQRLEVADYEDCDKLAALLTGAGAAAGAGALIAGIGGGFGFVVGSTAVVAGVGAIGGGKGNKVSAE